jgi:CRISPR-associated DxTHG motif protein
MTTFFNDITHTLNFLPVFFLFFFFSLIVECMQGERTTDSSVGWLNYNKSGRIYTAKCRCMEEKKKRRRRRRRAFDHATTTNPERRKGKKKKNTIERKRERREYKADFLLEGFISVFLSLLLDGDSSSFFVAVIVVVENLFAFELSTSVHTRYQSSHSLNFK